MGTARMGSDPARSVVDSRGRCHDVKNLFIMDGSIFTTSAAVNPTSTIQALALYIGNCIKKIGGGSSTERQRLVYQLLVVYLRIKR